MGAGRDSQAALIPSVETTGGEAMSEKQYVQYKNDPNGTKWEVALDCDIGWLVRACPTGMHYLPKSEYIPCAPPERWTDVTELCRVDNAASSCDRGRLSILHRGLNEVSSTDIFHPAQVHNYRVTKRQLPPKEAVDPGQWAFIVEKRED